MEPRTPERPRYRLPPEMVSDSPTRYSPVRTMMPADVDINLARRVAAQTSQIEEKSSKYQKAFSSAKMTLEKARAEQEAAMDAFLRAQDTEVAARAFTFTEADQPRLQEKQEAAEKARQAYEAATQTYQRALEQFNLIVQKVREYETIKGQVTKTLGGKKKRMTRRRTHKKKTLRRRS